MTFSKRNMEGKAATPMGMRTASGALQLISNSAVSRVIALVTQMVLAWLLDPSVFGLVGLTFTVSTLVQLLAFNGVHDVLVQRRAFLVWSGAAFWMTLFFGFVGGGIMLAISPLVVLVYQEPALYGMLAVMAVSSAVSPLSIVPNAVLSRSLRFKEMALFELLQNLVKAVFSTGFALIGLGAYSFVLPFPIMALLNAAILWVWFRPEIRWKVRLKRWRYMIGDASRVLGTQFARTAALQSTYVLLGITATKTTVGLYYFAYQLSVQPAMLLSHNLLYVLFPVFAKLNNEPRRQVDAFVRAIITVMSLAVPICLLQASVGSPLIRLLFGEKWSEAVSAFQILSLGTIGIIAVAPANALLKAQGRFKTALRLFIGYACAHVAFISIAFFCSESYLSICVAAVAASLLFSAGAIFVATGASFVSIACLRRAFVTPVALGSSIIGFVWLLSQWLPRATAIGDVFNILFIITLSLTLYLPGIYFFQRDVYDELKNFSPIKIASFRKRLKVWRDG